jgi:hypothetical protein
MPQPSRRPRSRQAELFARPKRATIHIAPTHRLVMITDETDWTQLEEIVQEIRRRKLKNEAGRPPHLRALIGALVFRALRRMTYRETEDQIRHYAPARFLCGLTETDWTPDANTIQDFEQLLGAGWRQADQRACGEAGRRGEARRSDRGGSRHNSAGSGDPVSDEMSLMATFVSAVTVASKHVGAALAGFVKRASGLFSAAKKKLWDYRLFAKGDLHAGAHGHFVAGARRARSPIRISVPEVLMRRDIEPPCPSRARRSHAWFASLTASSRGTRSTGRRRSRVHPR